MKKMTPLMRLGIGITIGVVGGEVLFQYEHFRRFGYWELFVPGRDIPAAMGLILVIAVGIYFAKKNTKRE